MPDSGHIETIECDGRAFAMVIRSSLPRGGHHFVSEPDAALQLGVNDYPEGAAVEPHRHPPTVQGGTDALEVVHFVHGAARLTLHDDTGRAFREVALKAGDTVLLIRGGHGLVFLAESRIVEVKAGPYRPPGKILI